MGARLEILITPNTEKGDRDGDGIGCRDRVHLVASQHRGLALARRCLLVFVNGENGGVRKVPSNRRVSLAFAFGVNGGKRQRLVSNTPGKALILYTKE